MACVVQFTQADHHDPQAHQPQDLVIMNPTIAIFEIERALDHNGHARLQ
jgi:hypothetical protein